MPDTRRLLTRENLEELVKLHQAALFRYARYLGADLHAAEDIVQETFLAVFHAGLPVESNADPNAQAAWLRGIARNHFLRHWRSSKNAKVVADNTLLEQAEAAWAGDFLRSGDGFDYLEALRLCLHELPDDRRRLLVLRYAEKKSRADMARLAGTTENGMKSILRRIRAGLAQCIKRRLAMESTDAV